LLSVVEKSRASISKATEPKKKSKLGQFFTPIKIAQFMAGLFTRKGEENCRLLDAGAGIGSLSAAFLERWESGGFDFKRIEIDAFEIDETLHPYLNQTIDGYKNHTDVTFTIRSNDFIESAVNSLSGNLFIKALPKYTHAILNPPYKKIRSDSIHRNALRKIGIETVNLYSAFVALSLNLLEDHGQLVAIIPRSFCNGPYYYSFRKLILQNSAIRRIHLFSSRNQAFKDDDVLQENVIIMIERSGQQSQVEISTSTDDSFSNIKTFVHPFSNIVLPNDSHYFIHIPTSSGDSIIQQSNSIRHSLNDLGITVSTGPVVDFRLKEYLHQMPEDGTIPLLYPGHFNGHNIDWPIPGFKKPNAIKYNKRTEKWFYPNGFYCIVRRFSSKEEKRRIVASVVYPDTFPNTKMLGFENHLNIFHESKRGLPKLLAYGLATYLNTTAVDEIFRRFNGHTQVNATDLRCIKYPSREALIAMGKWAIHCSNPTQDLIDEQLKNLDI